MSKYFEETVRLQSQKRREIRGQRIQGIAEGASSAPRLASSSAVSFPGRNECPGTHCSLIEQKEREDSSCQICHRVWDKRKDGGEDRTRVRQWQKRRETTDLLVLSRPAKSVQNGAGFSGKLEHTGPAEKERVASVPQREQLASIPEPPLPKGKGTEPSVQSIRS